MTGAVGCSLPMRSVKDLEPSVVFTGDNESDEWEAEVNELEKDETPVGYEGTIEEKVAAFKKHCEDDGLFSLLPSSEMAKVYQEVLEEFDEDADMVVNAIMPSSRINWSLEKDKRTAVHIYR